MDTIGRDEQWLDDQHAAEDEQKNNKKLKIDNGTWATAKYMCMRCGQLLSSSAKCPRCD